MMIFESLKKRHSIYALGKDLPISEEEVENLVKTAMELTPSAFNSQAARAVILFGEKHHTLWENTLGVLEDLTGKLSPETQEKIRKGFQGGAGTILFFVDRPTVDGLGNQFPTYKDRFPIWAEHEQGMVQLNVWTALAESGVGASLQHYNPVIDEMVMGLTGVPKTWELRAQMPFGLPLETGEQKDKLPGDERVKVQR